MTELLERVERETFTAPRLAAVRAALCPAACAPSQPVRRLTQIVSLPTRRTTSCSCRLRPAAAHADRSRSRSIAGTGTARRSRTGCGPLAISKRCRRSPRMRSNAPSDPFPEIVDGRPAIRRRRDRASADTGQRLGGERREARRLAPARGRRQRIEHVGQEHAAPRRRRQRRPGARRRARPRRASAALAARLGATLRIEDSLQAGTRVFTTRSSDSTKSWSARAGRSRCCFCSTKSCTAPIPMIAGSARKRGPRARRVGRDRLVTTHDLALTELPRSARRRHQHALRGSSGERADDLRLPHAAGCRRAQQRLALMRAIGLDV